MTAINQPKPDVRDAVVAALAHIWPEARADARNRIATIEHALATTPMDPETQAEARTAAHQLAGTLGTFGFPSGSELARLMEQDLRTPMTATDAEVLRARCFALRTAIQV